MKVRTVIAAAAAAVLGGTGALLIPAVASAHNSTHTLKFTSVTQRSVMFSTTTGAQQDRDMSKGKIIGFDQLYFTVNPATGTATGGATLDTNGGFMYFSLIFTLAGQAAHGKVTGGTGMFRGATGTIVARSLNRSGTRTAITITYR